MRPDGSVKTCKFQCYTNEKQSNVVTNEGWKDKGVLNFFWVLPDICTGSWQRRNVQVQTILHTNKIQSIIDLSQLIKLFCSNPVSKVAFFFFKAPSSEVSNLKCFLLQHYRDECCNKSWHVAQGEVYFQLMVFLKSVVRDRRNVTETERSLWMFCFVTSGQNRSKDMVRISPKS